MKKSIKVYSFFIFLLFLLSMDLWLGWDGREIMLFSLFGCGAFLVKMMYNIRFSFSKRNIMLVLLLYIAFLYSLNAGIAQVFTQIPSRLIPLICIVCVVDEYKKKILEYITKWYGRLMIISLLIYILVTLLPIPGFGTLNFASHIQSDFGYESYTNYIFYVKSLKAAAYSIPRFNGPFLEPGYVGMMGAFLLYANKFDLKRKENKIILLSVLVSLSLAGWMLSLIGYILNQFNKGKIRISHLLFSLLFIISFISFGLLYNGGDNIINERILNRLEYDEEKGFSGNNRNAEGIKLLAIGIWASDFDTVLFGYPEKAFYQFQDYQLIGSGFDHFLVHYGLMGVLLAFLFYIGVAISAKDKKFALSFLVFIMFCFWQRCYAEWYSWIICFYYSTVIADRFKILKK